MLLTGKRTRGTVRVTATSTARRTDSRRLSKVYTLVYVWSSSSSTSPTKRKQKGGKSLKLYLAHLKGSLYCSQIRDKINFSPAAVIRYKLWARHERGIFPLWLIQVHHSEMMRIIQLWGGALCSSIFEMTLRKSLSGCRTWGKNNFCDMKWLTELVTAPFDSHPDVPALKQSPLAPVTGSRLCCIIHFSAVWTS